MNTSIATTVAANTNIIMTIAMMTVADVTNTTNIIMTIVTTTTAAATTTKVIATKAAPVTAEKTAMRSKKIWSLSGSAPQFLL